jgi:hypothetical protein
MKNFILYRLEEGEGELEEVKKELFTIFRKTYSSAKIIQVDSDLAGR